MKMNIDYKVEYLSCSGGGDIVRYAYFDSAVDFDDFAIDMARNGRLVSAMIYTSPVSDMSKYFKNVGDYINSIFGVKMKERNYLYFVSIGTQDVELHHHYIEASNLFDACQKAHRDYLSPDKGFNCISVTRIKRGGCKK